MIRSMKLLLSNSAIAYRFGPTVSESQGPADAAFVLTPTIYQSGSPDFQSASTQRG